MARSLVGFRCRLPDHDQIHEPRGLPQVFGDVALSLDVVRRQREISHAITKQRLGLFRGLACGFGVTCCDALCSTGFVDRRHIGVGHDVNPGEPGAEALRQCDGQGEPYVTELARVNVNQNVSISHGLLRQ
jgi:hypothetical protein